MNSLMTTLGSFGLKNKNTTFVSQMGWGNPDPQGNVQTSSGNFRASIWSSEVPPGSFGTSWYGESARQHPGAPKPMTDVVFMEYGVMNSLGIGSDHRQ